MKDNDLGHHATGVKYKNITEKSFSLMAQKPDKFEMLLKMNKKEAIKLSTYKYTG